VFLEHLRSDASTSERLREVWLSLLSGVLNAHSAPLATVFFGHAATVRELAVDLGRRVHVEVAGETLTVTQQTASVVGTLLVHALRNAVDHGIETPAIRTGKGKNPIGEIRISAARDGELVTIEVSDDGAGLDVERTRQRAIERGILSADLAPIATAEQLNEFLFTPGFTTREVPTDVSGRGIGLDAARAAVVGHGGSLEIRANTVKGTTLVAVLPDIRGTLNVICFGDVTGKVRFAVSSDFAVKRTDAAPTVSFETILRLPAKATGDVVSFEISGSGAAAKTRCVRARHRNAPLRAARFGAVRRPARISPRSFGSMATKSSSCDRS